MALIVDTGGIYALYDEDDDHHQDAVRVVDAERGELLIPIVVLGEVDYLLLEYLGVRAEADFLASIQSGAFQLEPFLPQDLQRSRQILEQYRDLELGLVDASVMATAERLGVFRILTTDLRDFRPVTTSGGRTFELLPADG